MKIHILSDLHLEFSNFEPPVTDADVIVLAGDIGKGAKGVYWSRRVFPEKTILYVPGNHEYYESQRPETLSLLRIAGKQNRVHLLDDEEFVMQQEGVRFLGCTLWTDFCLYGEAKQKLAIREGRRLSDFSVIYERSHEHFSPTRSIELHKKSLAWLKVKLDEPFDGKTVVITHHMPSMQSVVDRYKNDLLSACFASELDYLFGKMVLWIHGHTHDNLDYEVNGTRVVCNPRGYVTSQRTENFEFIPDLIVDI